MPLVSFNYNDFIKLLGHKIPKDILIEKLPMIGGDFSHVSGDDIHIEFFPNRPDLTSVEGIARASRAFFGFQPGLQNYTLHASEVALTVDPSVKKIRPYVTTALVKNLSMSQELIQSLMGLQEKLHIGLGRDRKKVAIGIHNASAVTPPFTYKAVNPDSMQFIPLGKDESMTLREILKKHEKGIAYGHLLQSSHLYPIIIDAHNNVLSFPPIINGCLTEVTPSTHEVFIDVTGTDRKAINSALNIVTTALAERGGTLYSTTVLEDGLRTVTPDFLPIKKMISTATVNTMLGTNLTDEDIIVCLKKMGYNAIESKKGSIRVEIGSWRSDILHEVDLIEDVAVGFGFDRFETDTPQALTFGGTLPHQHRMENLRGTLIGLGYNEVTTFVISNEKDEFQKMGLEKRKTTEIENPLGEDYSILRLSLLPSLLKLLQENRHHPLPQQIFEIGAVVDDDGKNQIHLAGMKIDAKANFTESKSLIETILRECGLKPIIKETVHNAFINGRCATIFRDETKIGIFGELHPRTIQAFQLEHPMIGFELAAHLLHHQ